MHETVPAKTLRLHGVATVTVEFAMRAGNFMAADSLDLSSITRMNSQLL